MSTSLNLYLSHEALSRRVPRLPELDEQMGSEAHADVSYHLQAGPCFDLAGEDVSSAVSALHIEAVRDNGEVVGTLEALIFDMALLANLEMMEVFDFSEGTQALYRQMYQAASLETDDLPQFNAEFLRLLRSKLPHEQLQKVEESFSLDEYCVGFHLCHVDKLEVSDWIYRDCGAEMLEILRSFNEHYDFLVLLPAQDVR